ncbi:MAG: hypothetical protein COS43_04280 [Gallionellales bacterium CG03_land_8_20_14_0_80_55_15]|nr:MAG: hypothetical protein COS43_04280 [Gallionellales bacterium CG03_land_8_20_14_0_80_55_15]HCJ50897.1 hypothetical protein [Gallionella sp.]
MINPFDLDKHRELLFTPEPADQVERALMLLSGLPKLTVAVSHKAHALDIRYNLLDYTLAGLEHALTADGFLLDRSLLHNVGRNIIYYCEDTTLHNMETPSHVTKKNEKDLFVEVHDQHTHDDHAVIPPKLRRYE